MMNICFRTNRRSNETKRNFCTRIRNSSRFLTADGAKNTKNHRQPISAGFIYKTVYRLFRRKKPACRVLHIQSSLMKCAVKIASSVTPRFGGQDFATYLAHSPSKIARAELSDIVIRAQTLSTKMRSL